MRTPPLLVTLCLCLVVGGIIAMRSVEDGTAGTPGHYAELADIAVPAAEPAPGPGASTGSFTAECGRNESGHYNTDNVVTSPGLVGGAHHTHDYVGNVSTDARSTDASLAAAATTCAGGDRSTYFWPVLRRLDRAGDDAHAHGGGEDGNAGEVVLPSSVRVEFRGSPLTKVIAMPRFLRMITGDPVAATTNDAQVRAAWGCSGHPGRSGARYPICPDGSGPTRTLTFPSCWNGLQSDSDGHRAHIAFPDARGACPPATFPVPRLSITLAYALPASVPFAVDSFPEQKRHPKTDHAMFINVMTERQQARVAECVNEGRHCRPGV
ncbi:DUF1996 domain-containing protein [Streptomyces sp. NPDC001985]|uniref:DUF1996 domain-containing protein n=1 Tax=Streptomyces sp. NPDC001985 TaxID=3154406 RepID=UPI003326ADCA